MGMVDSYRPLFWISLVTVILGTLILLPVREDHRHVPMPGASSLKPLTRVSLVTTFKLSIFMGLIGLGLGFSVQFLPLWFYLKFGASGDTLGPWYAIAELTSTLAVLLVPQIASRLGAVKAVLFTQGASALGLVAMAIAPATWVAAGLMVIRTTLMNMSWPIQQSYTMGIVHARERATVSSLTNAAWGLASAISPVASGIWFDQRLLGLPLLAGAFCYAASALLLFAYFRHVRPPEERQPEQPTGATVQDIALATDLEDG
jgi:MFS family permease